MNREELEAYILNHYSTEPDYPWADTPRAAVFRHVANRKWFALMMEVPRNKLGLAGTEILDVDRISARRAGHFSSVSHEQGKLAHRRAGRQRAA